MTFWGEFSVLSLNLAPSLNFLIKISRKNTDLSREILVSEEGQVDLMKSNMQKNLRDSLIKKHVCYVLITCDPPSDDGKMNVEMSYEGDASLAAYLLQGAQSFIDEHENFEGNHASSAKICYFE